MNALRSLLRLPAGGNADPKAMAAPLLIVMILAMMVLPLPPFLLDLLFTFNIALSVMVLLVAMFTKRPLEFAAFPAVLLFTTLLRLSLNVASTRVVLMNGHAGDDAAGQVIKSFGQFLVGGNHAVGIVVFAILVLINFMVITKGAGRIAEVAARFALDALPGKQMAVDADLNAGLIGEAEARKRRSEVSQEADFHGSMDGASKFVRGDAIAGLLIMAINVIGGLIVGVTQHDMAVGDAGRVYTLLTIGDGLVAQIPSLVISTAAGVLVSRVATGEDVGRQLSGQLFSNPRVLWIAAAIIAVLGLVPGMPTLPFLMIAVPLAIFAHNLGKRAAQADKEAAEPPPVVNEAAAEASWDDVAAIDPLGLEVGYRLIPTVDPSRDGELLKRVRSLRKKFAREIGFLPPVVHIRDDLDLNPNAYRVTLKGAEIGQGEAWPGQWLAINPGGAELPLPGSRTTDPAYGLPAIWIDEEHCQKAQRAGYTVVDASTVVATHINHLLRTHASELLGRDDVQQLVDRVAKHAPKLVEDLVPKALPLTTLRKVLQSLLAEEVPIRDFNAILDALAEHAPRVTDPHELTALVRIALRRSITQHVFGNEPLRVIGIESGLESMLLQTLHAGGGALEPGLAQTLIEETRTALTRQEESGDPPALLVQHELRPLLGRFLRRSLPQLTVLSNAEIPDDRIIKITTVIGEQRNAD